MDEHRLSLNLGVDLVRRLIGGWQDLPEESGQLARQVALVASAAHLRAGHDVVVPQYLGRVNFIEQLETMATGAKAESHEFVLMTTRETAFRRFEARSNDALHPTYVEAGLMAAREAGPEPVGGMYDRLMVLVGSRPKTIVVSVIEGDPAATYQAVLLGLR